MRGSKLDSAMCPGAGSTPVSAVHWPRWAAVVGLGAGLAWSYWPTLIELRDVWAHNQEYSVGALVPIVAACFVWRQRANLARAVLHPCAWGAAVLVLAELARAAGLYFGIGSAGPYALLATLVGLVLLAAGWQIVRRLIWVFAFLLLMVPPPASVHEWVALPLQQVAASSAVFLLQLLGFFVVREGQVLHLDNDTTVALAEGCSGLRMLTAFVFVAATVTFLLDRPRWQKAVLLGLSVPIAVATNSVRLVATSAAVYYGYGSSIDERFHDFAGLAMMPLALGCYLACFQFLAWLQAPGSAAARAGPTRGSARRGEPVRAREARAATRRSTRAADLGTST